MCDILWKYSLFNYLTTVATVCVALGVASAIALTTPAPTAIALALFLSTIFLIYCSFCSIEVIAAVAQCRNFLILFNVIAIAITIAIATIETALC